MKESTGGDVSFEWSHHSILSTDSKISTTLKDSNIHSGSERVNVRVSRFQVEGKHSSDICSLSNAILHCEALRTQTADAVAIDNAMTGLVKR